jgi:hypothetical protein
MLSLHKLITIDETILGTHFWYQRFLDIRIDIENRSSKVDTTNTLVGTFKIQNYFIYEHLNKRQ